MDAAELNAQLEGRYTVVRTLGEGGMSVVYEGLDLRHDRRVAIKVLRPETAEMIGADRFLREIRVTAQLSHPHILPLLDSGKAAEQLFYVMPLVEGETLRTRVKAQSRLSVEEAVRITGEVADALAFAHGRGVLHRDIKPENILLSNGHALVADFGIARPLTSTQTTHHTATGMVLGTPAYMSPEQAAGDQALDERSDLYSLACVTYEMLAGQQPFAGPKPMAIVARLLEQSPKPLRSLRRGINRPLEAAITRALSPNPQDRQGSVQEFADELSAAIGKPVLGRRAVLTLVAAVLVVALVIFQVTRQRSGPGESVASDRLPRLAVLPLENLGAEADAPFAAGIAEEIMSRLSEIGAMHVVSRTSANQFRDSRLSMQELGARLNADYILEGSVRTDRAATGPGTARVTARLIRVADDVRVWEHPFDAILLPGDIFRVQTEIATRVAAALDLTLGAAEQRRVGRVTTSDSAAYRLYQLGRFQWFKRDAASLKLAVQSFRAAVARDPQFAEAYAGLADALGASILLYPDDSVQTAKGLALEAARRAVALDSSLAAGHASLGYGLFFIDWNWPQAEAEFKRAIELDRGHGPARYWYTQLLWVLQRPEDALAQAEAAVANDPLSAVARLARARSLRLLGREEDWAAELRRANELQRLAPTWYDLAEYFARRGLADSAKVAMRNFVDVRFGAGRVSDEFVSAAVQTLAGKGDVSGIRRRAAREGIASSDADVLAARLYAATGQRDSTFSLLNRLVAARESELMSVLPFLEAALKSDTRWAELHTRIGLPSNASQ